jgi:hypothetical protein
LTVTTDRLEAILLRAHSSSNSRSTISHKSRTALTQIASKNKSFFSKEKILLEQSALRCRASVQAIDNYFTAMTQFEGKWLEKHS